ncbi:MAG: carbohydrate ABC transporter permease [Oscillospiraceae bacterium]
MTRQVRIRKSPGDTIFGIVVYTLLTLIGIAVLYPLIYVFSASFSSSEQVISGRVWLWPVGFTTYAYEQVFANQQIISGYLNTIFYAVTGTIVSLSLTVLAAYSLSRKRLVGYGVLTKMFLFSTLFSGGLIPFYLVVRGTGLLYTRAAVVIPVALNFFHIVLMRTHIQSSIPEELFEAAEIDGCSHLGKLIRIVLPLSGSILAVLVLYNIVGQWNSYFYAMIFLKDSAKYPLQIILRDILINNSMSADMSFNMEEILVKQGLRDVLKYALIVVSSFPLLIIYPFVQKYFVKGVMMGSLKG